MKRQYRTHLRAATIHTAAISEASERTLQRHSLLRGAKAMFRKRRKLGFLHREVPKSFFDMTFDEQMDWAMNLLQGISPGPLERPDEATRRCE